MTIIAGAVALGADAEIPAALREQIRKSISRAPARIDEHGGRDWYLAKVDIGAFGAPAALADGAGDVSLMAGEPLLRVEGAGAQPDRAADLGELHARWARGEWSATARATGSFCAVHRSDARREIALVADKLGLRPIYYWCDGRIAVFATALRILEAIPAVPLELDERGVTEAAAYGFALGERTPYRGVAAIGAGQVVLISAGGVRKLDYWRWDRLAPVSADVDALAADLHRRFLAAVARRLRGARSAVAFLSGGLDSRSIVAALRELGTTVHAVNFALEGTQDYEFGRAAGRALGTRYHWLAQDMASMYGFRGHSYNQGVVQRWFETDPEAVLLPRRIWSGDGGSVGLGHVYLTPHLVALAQQGRTGEAIGAFLGHNRIGVFPRVLRADAAERLVAIPGEGMRDELARLECPDRGRALHLFLMLNDQRRHMVNFYENIDLERIELDMPFFDSDFLEPVLAAPVVPFLRHEFYLKWLACFPPEAMSVPWQAYPGHVPCPLPTPPGLRYQWTNVFPDAAVKQFRRDLVRETDAFLRSPSFPDSILSRGRLRLARWATSLGLRDCGYLLKMASVFCRYAARGERAAQG